VKASPEKPVIAQPAKPVSEDRNPVSPAGTFFRDTNGKEKGLGIDSITLSDPELKSAPPPAVSHEPIRLEGIAGNAQAAEKKGVPAPVVEKPAGTIDLEDLLFGDLEATLGSASSPAVPQASSPAPASSPAGLSGFDVSWNKPTPEPPGALDATATGFSETIHSQDTVQISPISIGGSSAPREIEAYKHPNDALDATVGMDERKKEPESAYGTPGKGSAGSQLDERSEKMFREQFDRAMKAFGEKNWKQAVHYLSIAAAIHPENTDVREKLREARDQKRKQEISA